MPNHFLTCLLVTICLLMGGCGRHSHELTVGKSTLPQLLDEMGQPSMVWSEGDGSLQMEFSRIQEGDGNYMARVSPTGILISLEQVLTTSSAEALQAGMSRDQVRRQMGRPERIDRTGADEVWHWPLEVKRPAEWQVDAHFGAKGTLTGIRRTKRQLGQSAGQSGTSRLNALLRWVS